MDTSAHRHARRVDYNISFQSAIIFEKRNNPIKTASHKLLLLMLTRYFPNTIIFTMIENGITYVYCRNEDIPLKTTRTCVLGHAVVCG